MISQCVWLYFNLSVSLREVELMMAYRGIQLSYETVRRWCDTFGAAYAAKLKRRRPKLGDKMVPRRSVSEDQRSAVLPLACRRSAGRRHRYSRAAEAGSFCCY